ncbi:MAG TPA: VOC family protein [Janthinobacterium sp.]|nr:VOC family protein [Janthinobacterium sp.]
MQVNPYLDFGGRCAEAVEFYKTVLNPQNVMLMPFRGSPGEEQTPEDWRDKIMHAQMQIGPTMLMGSDGMPGASHEGVKGCSMALGCDSDADAVRIFEALAQKGSIGMAMQETFWATKFGMLTDQFGVNWMVMCERRQ